MIGRIVFEVIQTGLAMIGMYHATLWVGARLWRRFGEGPLAAKPVRWTGELRVHPESIAWVCVHGHVGVKVLEQAEAAPPHCGGACVCHERVISLMEDAAPVMSSTHAESCPLFVEPIPEHHPSNPDV